MVMVADSLRAGRVLVTPTAKNMSAGPKALTICKTASSVSDFTMNHIVLYLISDFGQETGHAPTRSQGNGCLAGRDGVGYRRRFFWL
jgi:hypothetical protein